MDKTNKKYQTLTHHLSVCRCVPIIVSVIVSAPGNSHCSRVQGTHSIFVVADQVSNGQVTIAALIWAFAIG